LWHGILSWIKVLWSARALLPLLGKRHILSSHNDIEYFIAFVLHDSVL
jgi:hypothetical protein